MTIVFSAFAKRLKYLWDDSRISLALVSMHCVCLTGAGLPICKDSGMIPLKGFVYHMFNSALLIDIILGGLFCEYVIEVEISALLSFIDLYFFACWI